MEPQPIVEGYTPRGSIDTTFQEGREYLPRDSTKGDGQRTVRRVAPGRFGLSTRVVLLYGQLPSSARTLRAIFWRGKSTVPFSDMLTCVRRALGEQGCVHTQADAQEFSTLSPSFREPILSALAPAA